MNVCEMGTRVGLFFPEGSGADDSVSRLILFNKLLYNLCSFAQKSVYLGKKSLIKDSICGVKNDIFLYMAYKAITIILIFNEYY